MPVQIIEAIPQYSNVPDAPPKKLRCAYYARISLDEDGTSTSIAGQKAYFEDYIKNNPEYIFSGAYYDDGISGTSTRKRHGFTQMMRDVEENKLDVILVKSISRWGRNIVLTLSSLRLCAEHNCRVFFFKEGLWSDDPATNLILTIMSSMAEAESASISGNVALGIRFKFQQGKPMINCSRFLGYDKDPISKKLVINPFEARIVRFVYRAFLEGFSIPEIAKKLREADVPTVTGKAAWSTDTVRYILQNEKYCGDLLMQKTWVPSFLTHKVVKNKGKLPQYYVADNHDPIVPREVWNLTQTLIIQRGHCDGHPGQRKYNLSGKVICGCCGSEYKRFAGGKRLTDTTPTEATTPAVATTPVEGSVDTTTGGVSGAVWKCKARACAKDATKARARLGSHLLSMGDGCDRGGVWRCQSPIIPEEKLTAAVERALTLLPREMDNIRAIQESCKAALSTAAPTQDGAGEVSAAQLLLLHTDTALRFLTDDVDSGGVGRQGLACKTLDSFIARTPMTELGDVDPIELLVDRVVVEEEGVRIVFKAGVEI